MAFKIPVENPLIIVNIHLFLKKERLISYKLFNLEGFHFF